MVLVKKKREEREKPNRLQIKTDEHNVRVGFPSLYRLRSAAECVVRGMHSESKIEIKKNHVMGRKCAGKCGNVDVKRMCQKMGEESRKLGKKARGDVMCVCVCVW